jgi:hypothetical protein
MTHKRSKVLAGLHFAADFRILKMKQKETSNASLSCANHCLNSYIVANDGTLKLNNLPFSAGEPVEVIILTRPSASPRQSPYPLRGTPVTYIDPTEPVSQTDWEAAQ